MGTRRWRAAAWWVVCVARAALGGGPGAREWGFLAGRNGMRLGGGTGMRPGQKGQESSKMVPRRPKQHLPTTLLIGRCSLHAIELPEKTTTRGYGGGVGIGGVGAWTPFRLIRRLDGGWVVAVASAACVSLGLGL